IAHRVRQRQLTLVSRPVFQLQVHAHLIRRERVSIQSGAELMQQARENKRERLELSDGVFELEGMGKDKCGGFDFQMPLGLAGRQLLKFYSGLAQTFGNTGDGQQGEISKRANTPEP